MHSVRKNHHRVILAAGALLYLAGVAAAGDVTERLDRTFRLARGGQFELRNTNGAVQVMNTNGVVEVRDVAGECDIKTTNGRIDLAGVAGGVRAKTTNGSIELRLVDLLDAPILDLRTTNGGITAELPVNFAGWISARTTKGSIRSAFPVTIEERGFAGNRLEGQIGEGHARLQLQTTNGSIKIRKLGTTL